MHSEYKTLARLFHADRSTDSFAHLEARANERLTAESTFRTGINTSMGELFVGMPRELTLKLNDVLLAERKVSRLWNAVTGAMRRNYITQSIASEMLSTNEIEGVRSTRKEVTQAITAAENNTSARFSELARLYLELDDSTAEFPRTLEQIREIYNKIAAGEIDANTMPDGALFRAQDVDVVGPHGTAIHSGVSGEAQISALLTQMISLAHSSSMPGVIRASVAHFLFEYVHPFYDGNGRTGRYLLALALNADFSLPTVLSLSQTIADNKERYYRAFTVAEDPLNHGELTFFVEMMLDYIAQAQQRLIDELEARDVQMERIEALCKQLAKENALSQRATNLLYVLLQVESFDTVKSMSLQNVAGQIQLSKQSVRRYIHELEKHDLVEITSQKPLKVRVSERVRQQLV